jgi:hypothetical protein
MMQNESAFDKNLPDLAEASTDERKTLLLDRHIEFRVVHASFTEEVITN